MRILHLSCRLYGVLALSLLGASSAFAQANTATVYGSITDQSGAAVPGAHIQANNELTGVASETTSNGEGQFTFNFLPVGLYSFTVQSAGFQEQIRTKVQLSAGQTVELPFHLNLGNVKEAVTVSSEAPILDTDTAEQHLTIETRNVRELPLAKEDWTGLLQLGNGITTGGNSGLSLNGLAPASFNLTVDGTNASSDPELPSLGFYQQFNVINTVNSEAIAEVSVTKGIAPASVAGSMSGNVNLITKSGTNQFHGSLLEINSLSAYNARNQFLATKPRSTFNQFGGSLGGPILHDKLFFFGDYEGVRASSFSTLSGQVPTPQFVSQVLAVAPQYAPIFAAFPAPNTSYPAGAQTALFFGSGALLQNDNNTVARADYYITSKDLLTLRYTRSRPFKNQPRVIAENPRVTTGHEDNYNGQYTRSNPNWTFVSRFAYNRTNVRRLDVGFGLNLDQVSFSGFDTSGAESYIKRGGTYTGEESVAKTIGRHQIQFGGIVQRWNAGRVDSTTNTFSYSSLADFLADIPNQIQINFLLTPFQLHMYQLGGFIQDNFRVTPNLTLNLGLRYDYFTVPKEANGRVFNREATALGPGFGPFRPPDQMYNSDWPNFAPRLGFAWSLGSDRKTVLRGGSGIFYNPHTIYGGPIEAPLTAPNVPFRLTLNRAQALAMGFKYPLNTTAVQQSVETSGNPIANTAISANFPNPYSMQWYMGVEREILRGFMLETAYVGNRSLHLNMVRMENLPDRLTGVAPNPQFGQFRYYDGSDASWYNALQTSLKKRFANGLNFGVYYTYANNMSYGDADLQLQTPPQDNNNLRAGKGPTPYDVRHNFNASFVYEFPFAQWTGVNSRLGKLLIAGWQISGIFRATSGFPINITENNSSYPSSRPDVAAGVNPILSNYTSTLQYLNPAAFLLVPIAPASGAAIHPGNLGRNALRAPGVENLDASLAKNLGITERVRVQLRGDFFNALNHTNLGGVQTNVNSGSFGRLTTAASRSVQVGAKLVF